MPSVSLVNSDAIRIPLADKSVHMIATSPPYWGLRDYGLATWEGGDPECDHRKDEKPRSTRPAGKMHGMDDNNHSQYHIYTDTCAKCGAIRHDTGIGLEPTIDAYIANMVAVGRELWRVLRDDGQLWINLGDSYARNGGTPGGGNRELLHLEGKQRRMTRIPDGSGLKEKDLCMIPARVALALQADGWYLRSEIVWEKTNPMPESCTDRPTKSHEYVFLMTKKPRYFYDADAIREKPTTTKPADWNGYGGKSWHDHSNDLGAGQSQRKPGMAQVTHPAGRNKRSVWTIATQPWPGKHFAAFPEALVEPMIKAGTSERGCCPECGKAWERVTEVDYIPTAKTRGRKKYTGAGLGDNTSDYLGALPDVSKQVKTIRFRPACDCYCEDCLGTGYFMDFDSWEPPDDCPECDGKGYLPPIPCTVLDIFAGSGTTGVVARRLGRDVILLDLSFDYLHDQARARLELDRLDEFTTGKRDEADYSRLPLWSGEVG